MATAFCARGLNQGPPQLPLLGHGRLLLLLQVARQPTTTPQRVAQRLIIPLQIDSYEHRKAIDSISYSPPHQAVQVEEEGWVTPHPSPSTSHSPRESRRRLSSCWKGGCVSGCRNNCFHSTSWTIGGPIVSPPPGGLQIPCWGGLLRSLRSRFVGDSFSP